MRHSIVRGIFRSKSLQEGYRSLWQTLQSSNRASPCPRLPFQSLHEKDYVRFMSTTPPNDEVGSTPSPTKISPAVGHPSSSSSQPSLDEESSSESSKLLLPFPWRINAIKPLPRVIEHDDYSGMELTPWARFVRKSFVALELNASWVDIVFWKRWEQEMIQSCAFAFQRAMSGLLSRSFQVPIKDIIDFENLNCKSLSINTMSDSTKTPSTMTDEDKKFTDQYVANILDSHLLSLYTHIATQVQIDFSLTLIQVRLENAFMIPHLTRSDVYADSSLRGAYSKIERKWKETRDTDAILEMGRDLQVKTKHHGTKRSLLMDVSVICLEKFRLRDKDSGKILTGDPDDENNTTRVQEQIVTHLVRFEMETDKAKSRSIGNEQERELGHWKIVDIDDMMKGNVWY